MRNLHEYLTDEMASGGEVPLETRCVATPKEGGMIGLYLHVPGRDSDSIDFVLMPNGDLLSVDPKTGEVDCVIGEGGPLPATLGEQEGGVILGPLEDWHKRCAHHAPSPRGIDQIGRNRRLVHQVGRRFITELPDCPETEKALDALQLALMHANAAAAYRDPEAVPTPFDAGYSGEGK